MTKWFSLFFLAMLTLTGACTFVYAKPKPGEKGRSNILLPVWKPFMPKRLAHVYDHTILKNYRGASDCQPFCPQIDIWQYQYQPKGQPLISSTMPIASKKKYWKVPSEARIMSVTLFGNKSEYYDGFLEYLESISHIKHANKITDNLWGYETFTVRVYVAKRNPDLKAVLGDLIGETPDAYIQKLIAAGCEIAYIDNGMPRVDKDATFWRFMVAAEEMPEQQRIRYLLRDVDWRLTAAEAYAVGEWIDSGMQYHRLGILALCIGPMNASMWGGMHSGKGDFTNLKTLMESFPYRYHYGDDELFLRDHIWPYIKYSGSVMTHIYPRDWKSTIVNPFMGCCEEPTQEYCDAIRAGGKCPDIVMPEDIAFPQVALGNRAPLAELKSSPENFDMHLDTDRGRRVKKALSAR